MDTATTAPYKSCVNLNESDDHYGDLTHHIVL